MNFLRRWFSAKAESLAPNPSASALSPRCALCTNLAAEIELSTEPDSQRLRYSGPGGSNGSGDRISTDRADAIRSAFTPPYESVKIKAAGFYDDAGFCAACSKFYCSAHWNVSSTGGGECPIGHFKSLDPHWSPE